MKPVFHEVRAFAPATIANLGVGFDVAGCAVTGLGDTVTARLDNDSEVIIAEITGDRGLLSCDAGENTAGIAAKYVLREIGAEVGIRLKIAKGLPLGSGLGSSAASAVAAAVAVNHLFGAPLSRSQLIPACLEAETHVSGFHADNVVPALLGGIIWLADRTGSCVMRLPVPANLHLALITPEIEIRTAEARKVLPKSWPCSTAVSQLSAVGELLHALYSGELVALGRAIERDGFAEPHRSALIPLFAAARREAKRAGALGLAISGSGPTLWAVCNCRQSAEAVCESLKALYAAENSDVECRTTRIAADGARVLAQVTASESPLATEAMVGQFGSQTLSS